MKFFLLIALVAFVSAKSAPHILGDEECTQGPAFWCQDYKSAKQCGSVKYCIEHHWKKQLKGPVCVVCEAVVAEAHSMLEKNITQTEILQALEGFCAELKTYSEECKSLVDTYGKEIIQMLLKATENPEGICSKLGLCTSNRKAEFVTMNKKGLVTFGGSKQTQEPKSSALCIICEFAIAKLDEFLGSEATEKKITDAVKSLCSRLPATLKDECDALISEYGDQIIHLLIDKVKPHEICTILELCSSSKIKKVPNEFVKVVKGGIECEACEIVVKYFDSYLEENKTEAEIITDLEKLCSYFGSYKQTCDSFVSKYFPLIIKLLDSMPAEEVCKYIGLCTSNAAKVKMNQRIKLEKKTFGSKIGGTSCELCKDVVGYADTLLKEKKTQDEIIKLAEKFCEDLGALKAECDSLVALYLPEILDLLVKDLSPDVVCTTIGFCKPKAELKISKLAKKVKGSPGCTICVAIVSQVSRCLDNKTQAEITAEIEKLCTMFGQYKEECQSLVAVYVPEIIKLLRQEIQSPEKFCKKLGCCDALNKLMRKVKSFKASNEQTKCFLCKLLVGHVEAEFKSAKTEAEIAKDLEQLCSVLGTYNTMCHSYIENYLPAIIKYITQELDPEAICKEFSLCPTTHKVKMVSLEKSVPLVV